MQYSYTNLKDSVFDPILHANITNELTVLNTLNAGARRVVRDLDLRSTRRRASTSLSLFDEVYVYAAPSDLKGEAIADLAPQTPDRSKLLAWDLTTPEEFDRMKLEPGYRLAVVDQNGVKFLKASIALDADETTVSALDSLTSGGGTWEAFGDGENVAADGDVSVKGSGSVRFDISSAGGTTAGIKNTALTSFDITNYVDLNRSVFTYVWITSTTNLTNFIVRLGSSETAYYQITATTQADGTAFRTGWNLIKWNFASKSTTGSPTKTACTYAALYMTKAGAKVSETSYRFDHLVLQEGTLFETDYYSKYPWQTSAGVYIENSTTSSDLLNADTDEFDLFVLAGRLEAARDVKGFVLDKQTPEDYANAVAAYRLRYPSQALLLTNTRYELHA